MDSTKKNARLAKQCCLFVVFSVLYHLNQQNNFFFLEIKGFIGGILALGLEIPLMMWQRIITPIFSSFANGLAIGKNFVGIQLDPHQLRATKRIMGLVINAQLFILQAEIQNHRLTKNTVNPSWKSDRTKHKIIDLTL